MDISQMKNSKFLAQGDCKERPLLLTMTTVQQENVAKDGSDPELKWCVSFKESEKPLVLNRINMELIAMITGSTNTDNWAGKQVVLFNDPTISFAGKLTGGIRVRAPKIRAATQPATAPAPSQPATPPVGVVDEQAAEDDGDVPF